MNIALAVNVKERLISAVKGLRGLMGSPCGAMEGHGQESSLMRPSRDFFRKGTFAAPLIQ